MQGRLKSLFLFLTFKDQYAAKNYSLDNMTVLIVLGALLPTGTLILSGLFFLVLWTSPVLFGLAYISLIYGLLQLGHLYDYYRGRSGHV